MLNWKLHRWMPQTSNKGVEFYLHYLLIVLSSVMSFLCSVSNGYSVLFLCFLFVCLLLFVSLTVLWSCPKCEYNSSCAWGELRVKLGLKILPRIFLKIIIIYVEMGFLELKLNRNVSLLMLLLTLTFCAPSLSQRQQHYLRL